MSKKVIAIIPARGGSKRIPNKNILPLGGKPMIAWTIEAALSSGTFDCVLVSTESKTIAEVAKKFGAQVPFLRTEKYDDITPVSEATIAALGQAEQYFETEYNTVVQLMPNCPLRTSSDIISAHKNFCDKNIHFQISCFKFSWMNPWWAAEILENGQPESIFPEALKKRSQDLPDLFCPTGAIWIADANALVNRGSFYGEGYQYFSLDWKHAIDIDNYDDLEMTNVLMNIKEGEKV